MSSRREFLLDVMGLGTAALALPPPVLNFLFRERRQQPSLEWEKDLDGQTVWEAREMPIDILDLDSGKIMYSIKINGVDCQMLKPFLGPVKVIQRDQDATTSHVLPNKVATQEIFAIMPTVTGIPARYVAKIGYFYDKKHERQPDSLRRRVLLS